MATKPRLFDINLFYHVYNCGVEKRNIFLNARDYQRFFDTCLYYLHDQGIPFTRFQNLTPEAKDVYLQRNPKSPKTLRVKILTYCPMPNHFHFLVKPVRKDGITLFISEISNSYTKYFNIKNERIGNLLQGPYKSKEISTDESVLQVSRYIHLNPIFSSKTNPDGSLRKPEDYPYSSYREWLNLDKPELVDRKELSGWLKIAGGVKNYKKFVESMIGRVPEVGIEDLILE